MRLLLATCDQVAEMVPALFEVFVGVVTGAARGEEHHRTRRRRLLGQTTASSRRWTTAQQGAEIRRNEARSLTLSAIIDPASPNPIRHWTRSRHFVGEGIPGQVLVFAPGQEDERLRARGEDLEPGDGPLGRGRDAVIDPDDVARGPHLLQPVRYAGKGAGNAPHRLFGCARPRQ